MSCLTGVMLFASLPSAFGQSVAHPKRADLPTENEIRFQAVTQDSNGPWRYLHLEAKIDTSDMEITADQIRYNSDTDWAYANGHVHLEHFATGDKLDADHGEYNLKTQEGRFYVVSGTSPPKIMSSPGVLTTTNPFFFRAQWAERIKDRYIIHHGFLTDCKMPKPWWRFDAPVFDVIPGDRAIARHTVFRLKRIPILYLPYFYRPLGKNPRQSGFLTPNFGHTTTRGWMYGVGYYWAINRSYDMSYILQYFTLRGPAHNFGFRAKPNEVTDVDLSLYGVQDEQGAPGPAPRLKEGGLEAELTARTEIWGFTGRLDYKYLSSFLFRLAFANTFSSATLSQVDSVGYLQRRFQDDKYVLNFVLQRNQLFETITFEGQRPNEVILQKLPYVEFSSRDEQIADAPVPVWFSFGSSAGLVSREEPIFQTGLDLERIDVQPRVMTAFNFKGFSLTPSITFDVTDYGKAYSVNTTTYTPVTSCGGYPTCPPAPTTNVKLTNTNLYRKDANFTLDLRFPTLEKVYTPPKWLHLGKKLKHVIEGQAAYEYVTGVNEFQKIIHFDATDIVSNTNQLTLSLTNRLYRKDKDGNISEILTWQILQARYFDPTFGGAVVLNQRNVVLAAEEITPFIFLDGPRSYSPLVSLLRVNLFPLVTVDWRTDYDPLRHKFVDDSISVGVHHGLYGVNVGDTSINTNPLLIPRANQLTFGGNYGNTNRRGWNAGALVDYDMLLHRRLFDIFQVSYNSDCCGFSFQLRRFNLGIRNENQYLISFAVANIGSFGTLQKQARMF
ncbi:MAG: LPS-assembly protein LptD [Acidobacteriaceae bacterium]|nr:LPS-assembly protein LptD [Acidobacteriaceae bacterium]MBV9780101.1 LPS-assembly protein LptD [Acidobacteriaceae bacterium]